MIRVSKKSLFSRVPGDPVATNGTKNVHFLNILVNFGSCGKMLKIFLFLNFFEIFTLTIFIYALDLDPDPHQNFRSDPDPLQNRADPKPWSKVGKSA